MKNDDYLSSWDQPKPKRRRGYGPMPAIIFCIIIVLCYLAAALTGVTS